MWNVQLNTRNKNSYLLSTQTLSGPLDSNNSSLGLNTVVEASIPYNDPMKKTTEFQQLKSESKNSQES